MVQNKYITVIACTLLWSFTMKGQQQPITSHYMFNPYSYNPGAAGHMDMANVNMIFRNQWMNLEGAPQTGVFSINAPLTFIRSQKVQHAFGIDVLSDQLGFYNDVGFKLGYAMRFNVGDGKLGLGFMAGAYGSGLNNAEWDFGNENTSFAPDESFVGGLSEFDQQFILDLDFGAFYKTDELYVGISSTRLNAPILEIKEDENFSYDYVRQYYLTTGYNIFLPNPSFEIRPSFIIRTDGRVFNSDINALLVYNKKVWGGLSFGTNEITHYGMAFFGLEFMENLNVGLAYGIPSLKIVNYTSGTFEILLNYNFTLAKEKITKQYKSVRYL